MSTAWQSRKPPQRKLSPWSRDHFWISFSSETLSCCAVKAAWSYFQLFCHNTRALQTTNDRETTSYDNVSLKNNLLWSKCTHYQTQHNFYNESSDGQIQIMIWFKSWLNHWWFDLSTKDLIKKHVIWFGFDFILCDLIWWFEQITSFSNLGQGIMITLLVFLLQLS